MPNCPHCGRFMRRISWDEEEFETDSKIFLCDECGERVETGGYWDEIDKERGYVLQSPLLKETPK